MSSRYNPVTDLRNVNIKRGLALDGVALTATFTELNEIAGAGISAAELAKINGIAAPAGLVVAEEATFTETTGAGTYTGSVTVPAGASILDIQVRSTALWTATTSALMDVGDVTDPDGWYTQIDLKATDLLVGEVIRFASTGGKEGAYLVAASGLLSAAYSASARVVSGIVVTEGAAGNAGRTRMLVTYVLPASATAATKVAA